MGSNIIATEVHVIRKKEMCPMSSILWVKITETEIRGVFNLVEVSKDKFFYAYEEDFEVHFCLDLHTKAESDKRYAKAIESKLFEEFCFNELFSAGSKTAKILQINKDKENGREDKKNAT